MNDASLAAVAANLADLLRKQQLALATAESCTGGWIAKVLTDLPGSSAWFERGFVTYSNAAKQDMLGVGEDILRAHGAVSAETVAAMAQGALNHSRADLSLAVSGIAGPTGGTLDKPVGTLWFGWCRRGQAPLTRQECFAGDRDAVRRQAVGFALAGVIEWLIQ